MFEWLIENGWALWLIVFLLLAGIEILTLDLFFILMSVGAFAAMVSYFLGAALWLQVVVFSVVALAMILFVRPVALRHLHRGPNDLRTNVDRLIGHSAVVIEPVNAESGLVKIGGDTWSARFRGGPTLSVGSKVVVTEIDGATAIVATTPTTHSQDYPANSTG